MMFKCPICDNEMDRKYEYTCQYGVEESLDECSEGCNNYAEQFAYGNTEIHIGAFTAGYSHHTPKDSPVFRGIDMLIALYKEVYECSTLRT